MKIAWFGPAPATPRQEAELRRLFGDTCVTDFRGQLRNAAYAVADFRVSGADDLVVIAPLAVLDHLLHEGLRPLWAEAAECAASHPEREWAVKGKHFRFVGFRRLAGVELTTEVAKPLPARRPATVAWLSRHAVLPGQFDALRRLYGSDVRVRQHAAELRDAREAMEVVRRLGGDDVLLVGPLSLHDALAKLAGVGPLRAIMEGDRFVEFRRVTGLKLQFEAVGPR
jgi:hypothetical protein